MKITRKDSVAMILLRHMDYPAKRVAHMFDVTPYTVYYNTNEEFRKRKQNYQREYERAHR